MTCLLDVADTVKFDMKWKLPGKRLAVNVSFRRFQNAFIVGNEWFAKVFIQTLEKRRT